MLPIYVSIATLVATFCGGWFALRHQDRLHLVIGFSAGALLAVALFDLLPEAIGLNAGRPIELITGIAAVGFVAYMLLDRYSLLHVHDDMPGQELRGSVGAASLSVHSFLDGVAIGLAFKISPAVGAVVATAVLVHDFSDGINTVSLVLRNHGSSHFASRWLVADAVAPVLGVLSTFLFSLPEHVVGLILALFSGFFLYIGACDLLPESYHEHPHTLTTIMTILGMGVLFLAVRIAG